MRCAGRRPANYNIGNGRAEELMDFIAEIEKNCGKKATISYLPLQPGDVVETVADISRLRALGYAPKTDIDKGIRAFVEGTGILRRRGNARVTACLHYLRAGCCALPMTTSNASAPAFLRILSDSTVRGEDAHICDVHN